MVFILMDSVLRDIDKNELSMWVFFNLLRISETPMQNHRLMVSVTQHRYLELGKAE